jgi:2',3'-cyclic-nucleotide 3'-phosphodiesterase
LEGEKLKYLSETDEKLLFLDNTNVKQSEMEPYIKLAKEHGYVVVLIEPRTPWKLQVRELAAKNVHNVPFTTISRRLEQYDEILPCYFGWFVSQADCVTLHTTAKDILWKCLQITDFLQCIKVFSGDLTCTEFCFSK